MELLDGKKENENAHRLRKDRREGRPCGAEAHAAHEHIIQKNVQYAGDQDKVHRALGISHTAENGCNQVVRDDQRDSGKADP